MKKSPQKKNKTSSFILSLLLIFSISSLIILLNLFSPSFSQIHPSPLPLVYHLINDIYINISKNKLLPFLSYINFTENEIIFNKTIKFSKGIKGDCNKDGVIDWKDAWKIFDYCDKNPCDLYSCDIDKNGKIDFNDFVLLANILGGSLNPSKYLPYESLSLIKHYNYSEYPFEIPFFRAKFYIANASYLYSSKINVNTISSNKLCLKGECKQSWSEVGGGGAGWVPRITEYNISVKCSIVSSPWYCEKTLSKNIYFPDGGFIYIYDRGGHLEYTGGHADPIGDLKLRVYLKESTGKIIGANEYHTYNSIYGYFTKGEPRVNLFNYFLPGTSAKVEVYIYLRSRLSGLKMNYTYNITIVKIETIPLATTPKTLQEYTPCPKGLARLSEKSFQGNHNCDDNPQVCCPSGYHMCNQNELMHFFTMGCIDFDAFYQEGWVDYGGGCTCNGWDSNTHSYKGCVAQLGAWDLGDKVFRPGLGIGDVECDYNFKVWCCPD